MTWRLQVVHTTGYEYDAPVTASFNEARLSPRSDGRQDVIMNRIETVPATRVYRYDDYWGTAVTAFDLHAPHKELVVTGTTVVETNAGPVPSEEVDWEEIRSETVQDLYSEFLSPSRYVPLDEQLANIANDLSLGCGPSESVHRIVRWIDATMTYAPGQTSASTSAVQAWHHRSGVCQDFVHVTLLMLRAIGIPGRYVSGYLYPRKESVVGVPTAGESHSWVEAWTGSWWGIDPTNDMYIGEQHVSVGIGRDYADVSPLKGIYSGGGSTSLDVVVEVTRLA